MSIGEKSRSVLFDCCTNGLVGALSMKLDEYDDKDGARERDDLDSEVIGCAGGNRGSVWNGLNPGVVEGVYHGEVGDVPKDLSSTSPLRNSSRPKVW